MIVIGRTHAKVPILLVLAVMLLLSPSITASLSPTGALIPSQSLDVNKEEKLRTLVLAT